MIFSLFRGGVMEAQVEELIALMDNVIEDTSVPRNIRKTVEEAKNKVEAQAETTNLSMAIYMLDDISNDINMPSHTRTEIWDIISKLEAIKEKMKKWWGDLNQFKTGHCRLRER